MTPRVYWEREDASVPTDVERESLGLTEWWLAQNPGLAGDEQAAKRAEIATLLASDDEPGDEDPEDDADIFAEVRAARFLTTINLSLPSELRVDTA
jgi:hypothetical protein